MSGHRIHVRVIPRPLARSLAFALGLGLAALTACTNKDQAQSAAPDAATSSSVHATDAATPSPAKAAGLSADEGRALVKGACLSCHSEEMIAQQRLTEAQWTKTVTKMVGWGANLDAKDTAPLTAWLAATYGLDAGAYTAATIHVDAAVAELAPLPDGPFAGGDPERGRATFIDKCSGCHGQDARGSVGVRLIDRPFLYRASTVAETVLRGRGKMPPMVVSDADLADILAHLRRLKS